MTGLILKLCFLIFLLNTFPQLNLNFGEVVATVRAQEYDEEEIQDDDPYGYKGSADDYSRGGEDNGYYDEEYYGEDEIPEEDYQDDPAYNDQEYEEQY